MKKQKLATLKRLIKLKQRNLEIKRLELLNSQTRLETDIRNTNLVKEQLHKVLAGEVKNLVGFTDLTRIQQWAQKLQHLLEHQQEIVRISETQVENSKKEVTALHASIGAWEKYVEKIENQISDSIESAELVQADDLYLMKQAGGSK